MIWKAIMTDLNRCATDPYILRHSPVPIYQSVLYRIIKINAHPSDA